MYQYVNVANQAEFDAAVATGDYPHITNDARYEIREIPKGHTIKVSGAASPSMLAYDTSSPRMLAYDTSSPSMLAYDTSSPSMLAYDTSSPRMLAYDTSSPSMEAYDTSSPSMEAYDTSSPSMLAYDTSSPSMEAYDTSSPRMEAYDYTSVVYRGRGGAFSLFGHANLRNAGQLDAIAQSGEDTTHIRVPMTTEPGTVRATLARIEAHPEEWHQGAWAVQTVCGTKYCAAGHALIEVGARINVADQTVEVASLPDKFRRRFGREHVAISAGARAVLGLEQATADRLFRGSNDIDDLRALVDEICAGAVDPQPTTAADTVPAAAE